MKRRVAIAAIVTTLFVDIHPAFAYLKLGFRIDNRQLTLKWNRTPVRYFVNDRATAGITPSDFQSAVDRAFATWQAVPTASMTYQFGGFTSAQPLDEDGQSTLGFLARPELDRVLASTNFLIDGVSGELIESDIFFNSSFRWSTAPNGTPEAFDLESIALHEIGHLSGLGHSALGETEPLPTGGRRVIAAEATMFPIAFRPGTTFGRTLRADDIAGISDIYPDDGFTANTGSLSGRVTKNGQGLLGAHIVAFDPAKGTMVGNFALNADGQFSIAGLRPGPYVVRVEPLDDADVEGFFSARTTIDLNFRVTYYERLVVVPQGGDSGGIEIKVVAK